MCIGFDKVTDVCRGGCVGGMFAKEDLDAERRMAETYENRETWNRMSLHNIARSGIFAADRAVAEYADNIWDVPHR